MTGSTSNGWFSPKVILPPLIICGILFVALPWWRDHQRDEAVRQAGQRIQRNETLIRSNYDRARRDPAFKAALLDPANVKRNKDFLVLFYASFCRPDLRVNYLGDKPPEGPDSPDPFNPAPELDKAICDFGAANLKEEDFARPK